jgi:citrate lyase beta subunit
VPGNRPARFAKAAATAALHQRLGRDVEIMALIETALGLVRAVEIALTPASPAWRSVTSTSQLTLAPAPRTTRC